MDKIRKTILFFEIVVLSFVLFHSDVRSAFPQSPGVGPSSGIGFKPWRGDPRCRRASELNLSQEQMKGYESIQISFFKESQQLRSQLFSKRLEMKELLTNPSIKLEVLRVKTSEILEHQNKLEEKSLEYLIKIRALLTSDQLKSWCPENEFPNFRRMMQGPEAGIMMPRRPPFQENVKPE